MRPKPWVLNTKENSAGSFGVAAAFSFYPAKVLGSFGDAGAIVCNKDQIYQKMFQLHDHGRKHSWRNCFLGQKFSSR